MVQNKLEPQVGEVYKLTKGRFGIFEGYEGKKKRVSVVGGVGLSDLVIKLSEVSPLKRNLFKAKNELILGNNPAAYVDLLDSADVALDSEIVTYRLCRPDENLVHGIISKFPLADIKLGYHLSGTRKKTQFVSTSSAPLFPVAFAKNSDREQFNVVVIHASQAKGMMMRLDTEEGRNLHLNPNDILANPNARNAKEISFEAYLPIEDQIHFDQEEVNRLPSVGTRQKFGDWARSFNGDLKVDLSEKFGGLDFEDLL